MSQANDELTEILSNALSPDPSLRKSAEDSINKLAFDNIGYFLLNLSMKLSNENIPKGIRQISSTIIKNMVNNSQYINQWLGLDNEIKQKVKQHVLSTLASSENDIRKAAGIAIAGICHVDLPNKDWLDIFDILVNTSQNESLSIQLASVTTLGYIFEEISLEDIQQGDIAKILNGFFAILNKDSSDIVLVEYTLNAIQNFAPFLGQIIGVEDQRMILFDLVKKFIMYSSEKIRLMAIKIFGEFLRNYYDYFLKYIETVIDFTAVIMEKDCDDNKVACYYLWITIAMTEINRINKMKGNKQCNYYCQQAFPKLIQIILSHTITSNYCSDDWNITTAASSLLNLFSQCIDYPSVEKIIEYIGLNISSEDNDQKHAALNAFYSIIESSHKEKLYSLIVNSLTMIFELLNDAKSVDHIKEISASLIHQITEFYGKEFLNQPELFDKLLTSIVTLLTTQRKKVVKSLCHAIHYLVHSIEIDLSLSTNILSKNAANILNQLYTLAYSKGSYNANDNVANACFLAMGTLIERMALDTQSIKQQFFKTIIKALESTLNPSQYDNNQQRYDYQQYITSTISALVMSARLEEEDLVKCFNLLIDSFKERNCIYEEGIGTIGTLATAMSFQFSEFMQKYTPYLFIGLRSVNEYRLCRLSLQAACDVIENFGNLISSYVGEIVSIVLHILSNDSVERQLKLFSFNVMTDLFSYLPNDALTHFTNIMGLIGSAMEAAKNIPSKGDEIDSTDYSLQLREHLIEILTIIFSSIEDQQKSAEFSPYIPPIIAFVLAINNDDISPSMLLIKDSLSLICDFCRAYGKEIKGYLNVDILNSMINKIIQEKETLPYNEKMEEENLIKWSQQQLSSVLM